MRFLVTGGYGFMGSWVAEQLAEEGHEVFILSRSSAGRTFDSGFAPHFVRADLASDTPQDIAGRLPAGLDGCVHTASLNDAFIPNYGQKALAANVAGTRALLEALTLKSQAENRLAPGVTAPLRNTTGTPPMVIYASTYHVYGRLSGHIDESFLPEPRGDYALTHWLAEEYCRYYTRVNGLPSIILRVTNGYGTPRCHPFTKWYLLFHEQCRLAFEKNAISIRAAQNLQRDFIWMGEVTRVVAALLNRHDLSGQTFNLSTQQTRTLGEFVPAIAQASSAVLGREVKVLDNGLHDDEQQPLLIDSSSLRKVLALDDTDRLEEEVKATLAFLTKASVYEE